MAANTSSLARAVLYTRVSSEQQARSGLGLEAQLAACRRVAEARGLVVIGEFTDPGVSGRDTIAKRPGLASVLELAKRQPDVAVVVYSLSRLSRRQRLTWELLDDQGEYRLRVISASEPFDTTTPMGRAMLGMLAVWNALEADLAGERTAAALSARRARGLRVGPRPLAEESPETARLVRELYASGGYTHRTLAEELNRRGVATKHDKRWHATQVARMLRRAGPE